MENEGQTEERRRSLAYISRKVYVSLHRQTKTSYNGLAWSVCCLSSFYTEKHSSEVDGETLVNDIVSLF